MNPSLPSKLALMEGLLDYKTGRLTQNAAYPRFTQLIADLIQATPSRPFEEQAPLLNGNWKLLYTNRETFSPLEFIPGVNLGRVFQYIRADQQQVFNLAELSVGLLIAVQARFEPVNTTRLSVHFERTFITLASNLTGANVVNWFEQLETERAPALRFPVNRTGWLEVRYVDETLRISVGNEGSLFILTRA